MKKVSIKIFGLLLAMAIIGLFIYVLTLYFCTDCGGDQWICTASLIKWCTDCKSKNWTDITPPENIQYKCFEIGFFGNLTSNNTCIEIKAFCEERAGIK